MATNNSNAGFAIHPIFGVLTTFASEEITLSNGVVIPKGYLRATDLTQAASKETGKQKQWAKYFKAVATQEYLEALADDLGCLIENKGIVPYGTSTQFQALQPLVIVIKGGNDREQGIYIHSSGDLDKIATIEKHAEKLILKLNTEPLQAIKEAIEFYE